MEKSINLKDFLTIPNILTLSRIILITPFVMFFLNDEYLASAIVLMVSGLTDCLDGFIARKCNQITDIGKLLDPIADKLTLISIVVCVAIFMPSVAPIMVILIAKDLIMLIGGIRLVKKGITPPSAQWYGKISTVLFYISVITIVFLKAVFDYENPWLSFVLLILTTIMMIFSLIKYSILYFKLIRESK